jgi:hypothetical protein
VVLGASVTLGAVVLAALVLTIVIGGLVLLLVWLGPGAFLFGA